MYRHRFLSDYIENLYIGAQFDANRLMMPIHRFKVKGINLLHPPCTQFRRNDNTIWLIMAGVTNDLICSGILEATFFILQTKLLIFHSPLSIAFFVLWSMCMCLGPFLNIHSGKHNCQKVVTTIAHKPYPFIGWLGVSIYHHRIVVPY